MKRQRIIWCAAAVCVPLGAAAFAVRIRFIGLLFFGAAFAFAVYGALDRLSEAKAWARWAKRAMLALFCLGLAFFLALETLVLCGAHSDEIPEDVTCVIVLGGGVKNGEPQPMLQNRLDAALAFLEGPSDTLPVIVSGKIDPGETLSEAEIMARYLVARGLDASRIWIEDQASSTRTNFAYCYELMTARGIDVSEPFAFVTSDYHVYRSRYLANAPQARAIAAHAPTGASGLLHEFSGFVREAFALANEILHIGADLDL